MESREGVAITVYQPGQSLQLNFSQVTLFTSIMNVVSEWVRMGCEEGEGVIMEYPGVWLKSFAPK